MGLFSFFGGKGKKIEDFKARGAVVIDVRTKAEFNSGHVKGAKNIPLNEFPKKISSFNGKNQPLILCCASGMRSAQATAIAKKAGIEAINGGGWRSVAPHYK